MRGERFHPIMLYMFLSHPVSTFYLLIKITVTLCCCMQSRHDPAVSKESCRNDLSNLGRAEPPSKR